MAVTSYFLNKQKQRNASVDAFNHIELHECQKNCKKNREEGKRGKI